ncbi:MAG: hypothetical protein OK436_01250 [Thaumarchaeota archaeon]|nr:hypothetical protein [Nitrososphaerota archaeon]
MTSRRPKPDRPIRFVELKIAFRADKKTANSIRQSFPSAKLRNGLCEVKIESEQPAEMAEKARELLDKIRSVAQNPERL